MSRTYRATRYDVIVDTGWDDAIIATEIRVHNGLGLKHPETEARILTFTAEIRARALRLAGESEPSGAPFTNR